MHNCTLLSYKVFCVGRSKGMHFIFHKVASVLYGKYGTVMQIIVVVVVIGVKFQMLQMKSIAYLLKRVRHKIEFFLLSTTLFSTLIARTDSFELMV